MAKPLLIIGGQPVFLPEFRLFYDAVRSNVAGEFYRNYGTQPDRGFWHKVFPEGTPLAVAEKRALSALREWHATLELFRQEGLILTTGWPAFLARLSAENTRRTRLLAESLPVYGPKQLTRAMYLSYERDLLWAKIRRKYPEGVLVQRRNILARELMICILSSPGEAAEPFI
jgi:hypothetical protein